MTLRAPDVINNSSEKEENLEVLGDKKDLPETVGTPGTSGTKREEREIDRLVDSDIGVNGVVPGAVPNGTQSGIETEQAKANEDSVSAKADSSEQIRVAAISEFGMCGWVDPAKLAHALNLPFEVVEAWLQVNYVAYDRPNGGGIGYRQRRAGEVKA